MQKIISAAVLVAGLNFAIPAVAANLTIGTPTTGNCLPFGCAFNDYANTRYQQVWTGSAFGGPVTITSLAFEFYAGGALPVGPTFEISLSTTARAVNEIDDFAFDSNVGADDMVIHAGSIVGNFDGTWLVFDGFSFDFDPSAGNLLMDMDVAGAMIGYFTYFRSSEAASEFSRAHNMGAAFDNWGLVATFGIESASAAVPEPAAWAMMIIGFGLVGAASRRRASIQST